MIITGKSLKHGSAVASIFLNLKCQVPICCLFQPVGMLNCKIKATLEIAGIQYCLIEAPNGYTSLGTIFILRKGVLAFSKPPTYACKE